MVTLSVKACLTALKGDVPALKANLADPATLAAIDQLIEVPGWSAVSILGLARDNMSFLSFHNCTVK